MYKLHAEVNGDQTKSLQKEESQLENSEERTKQTNTLTPKDRENIIKFVNDFDPSKSSEETGGQDIDLKKEEEKVKNWVKFFNESVIKPTSNIDIESNNSNLNNLLYRYMAARLNQVIIIVNIANRALQLADMRSQLPIIAKLIIDFLDKERKLQQKINKTLKVSKKEIESITLSKTTNDLEKEIPITAISSPF